MAKTDYKALCREIFGTVDEEQIRKKAEAWKCSGTRNAGRKCALSYEDIAEMEAMLCNGATTQELAERYQLSRQSISRYLNARPEGEYTMRLDFKHGQQVCTVIYVDYLNRQIAIRNRTDDILLRAFGVNEAPNWEDFEQFLSDRCFPKTRRYVKQILNGLGVDSYDTLSIAELTGGRTAEDNMYLTFRSYPMEVNARARN